MTSSSICDSDYVYVSIMSRMQITHADFYWDCLTYHHTFKHNSRRNWSLKRESTARTHLLYSCRKMTQSNLCKRRRYHQRHRWSVWRCTRRCYHMFGLLAHDQTQIHMLHTFYVHANWQNRTQAKAVIHLCSWLQSYRSGWAHIRSGRNRCS